MKKGILASLIPLLCCMLLPLLGLAQQKDTVTLPAVTVTPSSNVDKAVTDAFGKSFKSATKTKWYEVDKNYLVKFINEDMDNNALYKQNGSMVYHISYGYEKNLDADLKELIQSSYPNYKVTRAIRVRFENREVWVMNLEGTKRWVLVRVEEGQLEEVNNFAKS